MWASILKNLALGQATKMVGASTVNTARTVLTPLASLTRSTPRNAPETSPRITQPTTRRQNQRYTKSGGTKFDTNGYIRQLLNIVNTSPKYNTKIGTQAKDLIAREHIKLADVSAISPQVQSNFKILGNQLNILADSLVKIDKRFIDFERVTNTKISKVTELAFKSNEKFTRLVDARIDDVESAVMRFDDRIDFHDSQLDKLRAELTFVKSRLARPQASKAQTPLIQSNKPSSAAVTGGLLAGAATAGIIAYMLRDEIAKAFSGEGAVGSAVKKLLDGKTPGQFIKDRALFAIKDVVTKLTQGMANDVKKLDKIVTDRITENLKAQAEEEKARKQRPWSWKPYWWGGSKGAPQQQQQAGTNRFNFAQGQSLAGDDSKIADRHDIVAKREILIKAKKIVLDAEVIEFKTAKVEQKAGAGSSFAPPMRLGGPRSEGSGTQSRAPNMNGGVTPAIRDSFAAGGAPSISRGPIAGPGMPAPGSYNPRYRGSGNPMLQGRGPGGGGSRGGGIFPGGGSYGGVPSMGGRNTGWGRGMPIPGSQGGAGSGVQYPALSGTATNNTELSGVYSGIPKSQGKQTENLLEKYPANTERFIHQGGRFERNGHVLDPKLLHVLRESTKDLPPGYRMEMISGADARDSGTKNHPNGLAIDVAIYDEKGNFLKHDSPGKGWGVYERQYQSMRTRGEKWYPGEEWMWGGAWEGRGFTGDKMHYQRKVQGVGSQGMGAYDKDQGLTGKFHLDPTNERMTPEQIQEHNKNVLARIEGQDPTKGIASSNARGRVEELIEKSKGTFRGRGPAKGLNALGMLDKKNQSLTGFAGMSKLGGPQVAMLPPITVDQSSMPNIGGNGQGKNNLGEAFGRSKYAAEFAANPALKNRVLAMAISEVGTKNARAQRAEIETFFNRSDAQGVNSIAGIVNNRAYYEPHQNGSFNRNLALIERDPELRARLEQEYDAVMAGSNESNYATHNASAGVASSARRTQTIGAEIGGETFSRKDLPQYASLHGAGTTKREGQWFQQTQARVEAAKRAQALQLPALRKAQQMQSVKSRAAKPGTASFWDPRKAAPNPMKGQQKLKASMGGTKPKQAPDTIERSAQKAGSKGGITGGQRGKQREDQKMSAKGGMTGGGKKAAPRNNSGDKGSGGSKQGSDWLSQAQGGGINTPRDNGSDSNPAEPGGEGQGDYADCLV